MGARALRRQCHPAARASTRSRARSWTSIPAPNTKTAGVAYSQQNYFASGADNPAKDRFYNLVFKFDQNFGSRHRTFFRHGSNDRSEMRSTNGLLGKVGADGPQPCKRINDAYVLDWVTTLSPTTIINPRVSFSRYMYKNDAVINRDFDMTSLGFPASLAASLPYSPGFGRYVVDDYLTLGKSNVAKDVTNTWATAVSLTKVSGTHTTKAGFDTRWIQFALADHRHGLSTRPATRFSRRPNTTAPMP